jgi:putative peptidoglycan lipid II flippase
LFNLVLIGPLAHAGLALAISAVPASMPGCCSIKLRSSRCTSRNRAGACSAQAGGGGDGDVGVLLGACTLCRPGIRAYAGALPALGALVVAGVVAYFGMLLLLGFRLRDFNRKALG